MWWGGNRFAGVQMAYMVDSLEQVLGTRHSIPKWNRINAMNWRTLAYLLPLITAPAEFYELNWLNAGRVNSIRRRFWNAHNWACSTSITKTEDWTYQLTELISISELSVIPHEKSNPICMRVASADFNAAIFSPFPKRIDGRLFYGSASWPYVWLLVTSLNQFE